MIDTRAIVALAVTFAVGAPASAQPLPVALAAGAVGERYDGYLGFAAEPTPGVRRQVNAINIKRRNLYIQLAAGKNASADVIGMTTACELFSRLGVGQAYLLQDNVWRRLTPGEPRPQPAFCR